MYCPSPSCIQQRDVLQRTKRVTTSTKHTEFIVPRVPVYGKWKGQWLQKILSLHLRCGYDDRPGQRHPLPQVDLGIACPGWHVHDEDVERAPVRPDEHLVKGAVHHRASEDGRLVILKDIR